MSVDKPSSSGDNDPDQPRQRERRAINWDLSEPMPDWVRGHRPRRPDNWDLSRPIPDWARDRPQERDRPMSAGGATAPDRPQEAAGERPQDARVGFSPEIGEKSDKNPDAERISKLETDLAETSADRRKLIDVVSRQETRIERLESDRDRIKTENDRLKTEYDKAKSEIERLKAELAEKQDNAASDARSDQLSGHGQAEVKASVDRPWYRRLPSEKLIGVGAAAAGTVEAVAASAGHLSSSTGGVITATVGLGVAGLGYIREKHEEKRKNADRPEG